MRNSKVANAMKTHDLIKKQRYNMDKLEDFSRIIHYEIVHNIKIHVQTITLIYILYLLCIVFVKTSYVNGIKRLAFCST